MAVNSPVWLRIQCTFGMTSTVTKSLYSSAREVKINYNSHIHFSVHSSNVKIFLSSVWGHTFVGLSSPKSEDDHGEDEVSD